MAEDKFKYLKEEEQKARLKEKAKRDIKANPIPEILSATPANIKVLKIRIENIEKLLGLQ